ncbi:VOC family protein [Chitinibacteraceae bacterium HSL-7]
MTRSVFVNLPVSSVSNVRAFFSGLGFSFNEEFSNEQALCMVLSETGFVMLLDTAFFATFTPKPVANAHEGTQVLVCVSCSSREEVDQLVAKAVASGGAIVRPPQDYGFMYSHAFSDPDGHIWELVHMTR